MADFSFLSDSDNEKAVEELLSQAMDQSVLEQVAAINCSGFTDSVLPTQLETRFRKLKSLPAAPATPKPSAVARNSKSFGSSEFPNTHKTKKIDDENEKIEGSPVEEKGSKVNLEDGFVEKQTKSQMGKEGKNLHLGQYHLHRILRRIVCLHQRKLGVFGVHLRRGLIERGKRIGM
ncbi:hypothetical protein AABB24_033281 [Solanum stoloniferum]|uniref:Uncharacterized protein n=1 Tax=Solanum stoloniferum TaxID=62892 RepID=A0ABD2RPT4_9SOLN